jgi:hypothetical protein
MKLKLAKIGRALLGALYVGSGIFNLTVTTTLLTRHPTLYSQWVAKPLLPFYKPLFAEVVTPNAVLLTVLVALYELVIGGLIWSSGRAFRIGLLGGMLFNVLLAPMWIGQTICNLLLAALHVPLLRYDFPPLLAQWWKQGPRHHPQE